MFRGLPIRRAIGTLLTLTMVTSCSGTGDTGSDPGVDSGQATTQVGSADDPVNSPTTVLLPDPGPNPSTIEFVLDESAAVTSTIGRDGGALATSSGGIELTLVIPPDAVAGPTEITMTPVAQAESDLVDLTMGGAQFAPAGLLLAQPAVLELSGPPVPADVIAVSWEESAGEVVPTLAAPPIDGRIQIPVVHFSGAGAGAPGSAAATAVPSSKADRAVKLLADEFASRAPDYECVEADSAAGVTALNYYIGAAREEVIPALKEAQTNDLALLEAGRIVLDWWAVPDRLREFSDSFVCAKLVQAFVDARDGYTEEIGARLEAGFTHAIYEAVRQCNTSKDTGEVRHMVQWHERAVFMLAIGSIGAPEGWSSLLVEAVKACAVFRVELRTQLSLDAGDAGRIRGTIAATATDVPERFAAELLGYSNQGEAFQFNEPSYRVELPHDSASCAYVDRSELTSMRGQFLRLTYPLPERRIPGLSYPPDKDVKGDKKGDKSSAGQLVIDTLDATGSVVARCDDVEFALPHLTTLIPMWFNGAHRSGVYEGALEFRLEEEQGGSLAASFTTNEPIVDPTDPTAQVTQDTEVKIFHTPQNMARPEPAPPPDVFP